MARSPSPIGDSCSRSRKILSCRTRGTSWSQGLATHGAERSADALTMPEPAVVAVERLYGEISTAAEELRTSRGTELRSTQALAGAELGLGPK